MEKVEQSLRTIYSLTVNNYKFSQAIKEFESLAKGFPELWGNEYFLIKLAFFYDHLALQQKKRQARFKMENFAMELYKKALTLDTKSTSALWGIGRGWWHRKSKKAISYAKKVYFLVKKDGEPTGLKAQVIGLCYKAVENYERAEYWLLRGYEEGPPDSGLTLNICKFYSDVGDHRKAVLYAKRLRGQLGREDEKVRSTKFAKDIEKFIDELLGQIQK